MNTRYCGHCHTCGDELRKVLDGEEWCNTCKAYRRYFSHGWGHSKQDNNPYCPPQPVAYRVSAHWAGIPDSDLVSCRTPFVTHIRLFACREDAQVFADRLTRTVIPESAMSYTVTPVMDGNS